MEKSRIIRVTGKGNLKVHPDMTRITIELTGVYPEYSATLEQASRHTEVLRRLMEPFGFNPSDLKTVHFSVDTETESYEEAGTYKRRFIGYRFTHELKVEFDSDNKRLGKILYALANSPLGPEFHLSYTVKDPEAVKNQLLGKAVKDAKAKANILASAAEVTLGEILSLDYSWNKVSFETRPIEFEEEPMVCAAPKTSYDLNIEPDDIQASDTVTVVWEIK